MACRGFSAEYTRTELDQIQVKLEYSLLFHPELEHVGNDKFLDLSHITATAGKKKVFGQLLRDGRTACDDFSFLAVFFLRL